jgi:hypothetical protein
MHGALGEQRLAQSPGAIDPSNVLHEQQWEDHSKQAWVVAQLEYMQERD